MDTCDRVLRKLSTALARSALVACCRAALPLTISSATTIASDAGAAKDIRSPLLQALSIWGVGSELIAG